MNKNQGATAGALILAGALLRPLAMLSPSAPPQVVTETAASPTAEPAASTAEQGPWIASCNYWAPSRPPASSPPPAQQISIKLTSSGTQFDSHVTGTSQVNNQCAGDPWGIPPPSGPIKPDITAIIAEVPDPLHANPSLAFDRAVDSLLEAAADNGFVQSYYWLPWKKPDQNAKDGGSSETPEEHDRERLPGLIILKHVAFPDETKLWPSYNRVVYLFLVGGTAVLGVNGNQLESALKYEAQLKQKVGTDFKLSILKADGEDPHKTLAVIGPDGSGAAASLRAGLERSHTEALFDQVEIAGWTATKFAADMLNLPTHDGEKSWIHDISFGANAEFTTRQLLDSVEASGHYGSRVAFLVEDGTVFGQRSATASRGSSAADKAAAQAPVVIRFPMGISLLRNAHKEDQGQSGSETSVAPSPYLHLSLQDSSVEDTVPHFSATHTPISQEAELMEIARQLKRYNIQFISIVASNGLDEIFLAKFLHRAVPDARLFATGDLLYEHDTDDVPFVGALTLTQYNLVAPVPSSMSTKSDPSPPTRAFSSSLAESIYNAASYTFWDGVETPKLANYRSIFNSNGPMHASLWATVIGRDGYYPVGVVNECASNSPSILPSLDIDGLPSSREKRNPENCAAFNASLDPGSRRRAPDGDTLPRRLNDALVVLYPSWADKHLRDPGQRARFPVNPSLWWYALCSLALAGCIFHVLALRFSNFWSPFTRDLSIDENDEPSRRALDIHLGTVMLFCMAVVVAYPIFPSLRILKPQPSSIWLALLTLCGAVAALLYSFARTFRYAFRGQAGNQCGGTAPPRFPWRKTDRYIFFHGLAFLAMLGVPIFWIWMCETGKSSSHLGLFFSYRCLNPTSGVSPVLPVLVLLFSWYLWSVFQTRRLRFSDTSRPRLPGKLDGRAYKLFVSDDDLAVCGTSTHPALYRNITCLLITHEVVRRFFPQEPAGTPASCLRRRSMAISTTLLATYLALFVFCLYGVHVEGLESILWLRGYWWPTPYEFLVEGLFFPLLMIALAGWLRMILIWGSLRRGLLEPLERLPIRFAFSHLDSCGWMAMMRQGDLHERWREMARSAEATRHLAHNKELSEAFACSGAPEGRGTAAKRYATLAWHTRQLVALASQARTPGRADGGCPTLRTEDEPLFKRLLEQKDIPEPEHAEGLLLRYLLENDYAEFARDLLEYVLIPYWENRSEGFVEGETLETVPVHAKRSPKDAEQPSELELHAGPAGEEPLHIRLAEEFVAIRYVSLMRAVLVNIRHLMTFITCAFAFSVLAWNFYPFQPRQWIDATFTVLLLFMGAGMVWVLAQMHRNTILSRITRTRPNELGADFYLRIATFGALPVLTWLAYQFPSIGDSILRFLQPGLQVVK